MTVAIEWHAPFAAPTLTAELADGGSLLANTTYYYRVNAMRSVGAWHDQEGLPSNEVSVTTTDTKRTVVLDWDAVVDNLGQNPTGYTVYRRKADQTNYYFTGSFVRGASGNDTYGYTVLHPTTAYTDDGTGATANPPDLWVYPNTDTPFTPALGRGLVYIVPDATGGSITVDQVHAAVGTTYSTYGNGRWTLQAHMGIKNGGPVTFAATGLDICMGSFYSLNTHANTAIVFGALNGSGIPYDGCSIWEYGLASIRQPVYGLTLYDTIWRRISKDYVINAFTWSNSPRMSGSIVTSNTLNAWLMYVNAATAITDSVINGHIFPTGDCAGFLRNRVQAVECGNYTLYETTLTSVPFYGWTSPAHFRAIATPYNSYFVDCTFLGSADNTPIIYGYQDNKDYGTIHVRNRLDVLVALSDGTAVPGATVTIADKNGAVVYTGTTDANGAIPTQTLTRCTNTHTAADGIVNTWYTPYTITVYKLGYLETALETSLGERVKQTVTLLPLDAQYITDIAVDVATPPAITVDIETPPVITVDVHIGG